MLILELKHPYFKFSQSRVFAHIYICVYIEEIIYWKCVCMPYSSVYIYFYSIKGITLFPIIQRYYITFMITSHFWDSHCSCYWNAVMSCKMHKIVIEFLFRTVRKKNEIESEGSKC